MPGWRICWWDAYPPSDTFALNLLRVWTVEAVALMERGISAVCRWWKVLCIDEGVYPALPVF